MDLTGTSPFLRETKILRIPISGNSRVVEGALHYDGVFPERVLVLCCK